MGASQIEADSKTIFIGFNLRLSDEEGFVFVTGEIAGC